MPDKIIQHEDMFQQPFLAFCAEYYQRERGQLMPAIPDIPLESFPRHAFAYVNHGRWVVECPEGCGNAKLLSREVRFYICTSGECKSEGWYVVVLPHDREAVERELLRRPADKPDRARTRNWNVGEEVDGSNGKYLELETIALLRT